MNGLVNIILNETMTEQEKGRCIKHYTEKKCKLINSLAEKASEIEDGSKRLDYIVTCLPRLCMF